jgi:hypothetical protein
MRTVAVVFCLALSMLCEPAQAVLTPTFRVPAYEFFHSQCQLETLGNPTTKQLMETNHVLEQVCACMATLDSMNVTFDEWKIISATGNFPQSFRDRKDGYVRNCLLMYLQSAPEPGQ